MKINQAKNALLGNKKITRSFKKRDLEDLKIHVGLQILELRLIKNLSQKQLARRIGTKQPSIARAERGAMLPSLAFLQKIALAAKTDLVYPKFSAVEERESVYQLKSFQEDIKTAVSVVELESNPIPGYEAQADSSEVESSITPFVSK